MAPSPAVEASELPTPVEPRTWNAFRALHHREFRLVWSASLVGFMGFWLSFIATQVLIARLTDDDATWLGLFFFVNFIPLLVFSPLAGVVADRFDRKRILLVGHGTLAALVAGLAVLTLSGAVTPTAMLPFAFAMGTVFAFNAPASQAIVANSVPLADLPSAISLQSSATNLSRVLGPVLVVPVLAIANEGLAFATYAVASVLVVMLLRPIQLSPYARDRSTAGLWRRLGEGVQHARARPPAMAALSLLFLSSLFAAAYLALLPLAAKVFDRGANGFTMLAVASGVGSMFGAITTGFRQTAPTLRVVATLVASFGATLVLAGLAPSWGLALVAFAVVGACYFAAMTTLSTLLQYLADEDKRGRMMSLFVIGWGGLVPIGGLWQGPLAEAHGVRAAFVLAGAVTASYGVLVALMTIRATRHPAGDEKVGVEQRGWWGVTGRIARTGS